MLLVGRRRFVKRVLISTIQLGVVAILFIFGFIPLLYHYSYSLQRNLLFLPFVNWPRNVNFDKPELLGLVGTKNLYLSSAPDVKLGIWHILPKSLVAKAADGQSFESLLKHGEPVILYVHGNSGSRAGSHRVELYQVLRDLDYHIVCFDYRGYGDSSNIPPTEDGVVEDTKFMYQWVQERVGNSPLLVWGHSLGTGVSARMVAELSQNGVAPVAVILEAPFTNIRDEVRHHPMAKMFRWLPMFDWLFLEPFTRNKLAFESDKHISAIHSPILILHAEDDAIVPYVLGEKLYNKSLIVRPRNAKPVKFVPFASLHHYGHKYICRAPELPDIIRKFVNRSITNDWSDGS